MNNVSLIGRLVRDPELRYIPVSGRAVTNFTIAVDRGLSKEKRQEVESKGGYTADFIDIVAWGVQAENIANYLQKGLQVGIQGRIQTGSYEDKKGIRRKKFDVVAEKVHFIDWPEDKNNNQRLNSIEGFHPVDDDDIPF